MTEVQNTSQQPLSRRESRLAETRAGSADEPRRPRARRQKGILGYLATGVMAGVLVVVLGVGALAIVIPALTGSTALTVMTSSMEPTLPPGTMVVVRPTPVDEIVPGDVLTYQLRSGEGTLVTHRVLQQMLSADGERLFITQGDNNPAPDPDPIREVQVVGTVWYSIPFLGWVSVFVTGDVKSVVIPVVVGALLLYATWMIIAGLRERSRSSR